MICKVAALQKKEQTWNFYLQPNELESWVNLTVLMLLRKIRVRVIYGNVDPQTAAASTCGNFSFRQFA